MQKTTPTFATLEQVYDALAPDLRADGYRGVSKHTPIEQAIALAGTPLEERTQGTQRVLTYLRSDIEQPPGSQRARVTAEIIAYDGQRVSQTRIRIEHPTRSDALKTLVTKLRGRLRELHGKPAMSRSGSWQWKGPGGASLASLHVSHSDQAITLVV